MTSHGRDAILSSDDKPASPLRPENIAKDLKALKRWIGWRWKKGGTKWTKPPCNVLTGYGASSTDPDNWYTFDEAIEAQRRDKIEGIGIALGETVYGYLIGVDFDDVRDPATGKIDDWVLVTILELDSYTEVSPSGTGLKVFFLSMQPVKTFKDDGIEVYDASRYFTVTGLRYPDVSKELEDRTEIALKLFGAPYKVVDADDIERSEYAGDFCVWTWLEEWDVGVKEIRDYEDTVIDGIPGRYKILLEHCPFNASHDGDRPAIIVNAKGRPGFNCFHHGCSENHWAEFKAKIMWDHAEHDFDILPEIKSVPAVAADTTVLGLSKDVLQPTGLIGEIAKYTLATSPYQQPLFALSGAIGMMATLCGRVVADPINTRSNVYIMNVGQSGCGKAACQKTNRVIATAVEQPRIASTDWPTSEAGLLSELSTTPSLLMQPDEIGKLIAQQSSDGGRFSTSTLIIKAFLQAYTLSGSTYSSASHAKQKDNVTIVSPNVSIVGSTTHDIYRSLSSAFLTDGFLGRFIIFETDIRRSKFNRRIASAELPESLLESLKYWATRRAAEDFGEPITVIPYGVGVEDRLADYQDYCDQQILEGDSEDPRYVLWTRVGENVRKLALIKACSTNRGSIGIEAAEVDWAIEVVESRVRHSMEIAARSISDSQFEADCQKVMQIIRAKARSNLQGYAKKNDVLRSAHMRSRDMKEILETLELSEMIEVAKGEKGENGKQPFLLRCCDVAPH